jgi:hypothetical protein
MVRATAASSLMVAPASGAPLARLTAQLSKKILASYESVLIAQIIDRLRTCKVGTDGEACRLDIADEGCPIPWLITLGSEEAIRNPGVLERVAILIPGDNPLCK